VAALVLALAPPAPAQLDEARAAQVRGAELHRAGDLQGALREFDRVVRLAPDSALAWYNRGLVRRDLKDCRAAIGDFGHALELQPGLFNALYQRGNCLQVLGEYERAIDDYSRAVALPGRIDARFLAHYGRADALRRLGRLEEAYAAYTRVSELRTDTTALRSRAWVSFYRGHWREAYVDAANYVHDTEAKEPDAAYAVILGVLALRRLGEKDQDFVAQWEPRFDSKTWPAPVLRYLKGEIGERQLLDAAKTVGERTEALAYTGASLLAAGQRQKGIDVLQRVLREGEPGYLEYDLAYHELRRLGLAAPSDRRQRKR